MQCMASSNGTDAESDTKPTIEFMVTPDLKSEIESVAGDNRMTKSEVMRAITRDGLQRVDAILESDDGAVRVDDREVLEA